MYFKVKNMPYNAFKYILYHSTLSYCTKDSVKVKVINLTMTKILVTLKSFCIQDLQIGSSGLTPCFCITSVTISSNFCQEKNHSQIKAASSILVKIYSIPVLIKHFFFTIQLFQKLTKFPQITPTELIKQPFNTSKLLE